MYIGKTGLKIFFFGKWMYIGKWVSEADYLGRWRDPGRPVPVAEGGGYMEKPTMLVGTTYIWIGQKPDGLKRDGAG